MLSKNECNRIKSINEALEDIIIRHYGEDYRDKSDEIERGLNGGLHVEDGEWFAYCAPTDAAIDLVNLVNALDTLRYIEKSNWNALNDSNKVLDTGE